MILDGRSVIVGNNLQSLGLWLILSQYFVPLQPLSETTHNHFQVCLLINRHDNNRRKGLVIYINP
jgi:hypothetical protein